MSSSETDPVACYSGSCSAYTDAIPGITPEVNDSGDNGAQSRLFSNVDGSIGPITLYGPSLKENDFLNNLFITLSKEDARNKYIFLSSGYNYIDPKTEVQTQLILKVNNFLNPELYDDYQLTIPTSVIRLARGTYYLRSYFVSSGTPTTYTPIATHTITIKMDPIQGIPINKKYTDTAYTGRL